MSLSQLQWQTNERNKNNGIKKKAHNANPKAKRVGITKKAATCFYVLKGALKSHVMSEAMHIQILNTETQHEQTDDSHEKPSTDSVRFGAALRPQPINWKVRGYTHVFQKPELLAATHSSIRWGSSPREHARRLELAPIADARPKDVEVNA